MAYRLLAFAVGSLLVGVTLVILGSPETASATIHEIAQSECSSETAQAELDENRTPGLATNIEDPPGLTPNPGEVGFEEPGFGFFATPIFAVVNAAEATSGNSLSSFSGAGVESCTNPDAAPDPPE